MNPLMTSVTLSHWVSLIDCDKVVVIGVIGVVDVIGVFVDHC